MIIITVLIIGATGFLGNKLIQMLKEHNPIGTYHNKKHENYHKLDISNKENILKLVKEIKPNIIINTSHIPNSNTEEMKELAKKINSLGPKNLAEVCNDIYKKTEMEIKLIHMSTDFIFDGEKGNYSENDKTNPISHYGKTKLAGEQGIHLFKNHIILRVSTLYGYSTPEDKKFTNWIISSLKEKKEINILDDQFTCPTLIDNIGKAIILLLRSNKTGTYHCVGSEKISRYGFAVKVAEKFNLDKNLIKPTTISNIDQNIIRPKNTTLNISKLESEGIQMCNVDEGLEIMKNQMDKGV